jgi:hypothetical protein
MSAGWDLPGLSSIFGLMVRNSNRRNWPGRSLAARVFPLKSKKRSRNLAKWTVGRKKNGSKYLRVKNNLNLLSVRVWRKREAPRAFRRGLNDSGTVIWLFLDKTCAVALTDPASYSPEINELSSSA